MEDESDGDDCVDRLTDLPDVLLGSILTLLPGKQAARTAILSKRWRHLWFATPLNLDLQDLVPRRYSSAPPLASTLSDLLSRHSDGASARLVRMDDYILEALGMSGIETLFGALARKNVEQLCFTAHSMDVSRLPLHTVAAAAVGRLINLKELKLLFCLHEVAVVEDFTTAISGLPVLENLELKVMGTTRILDSPEDLDIHSMADLTIRSKSLKMLKIVGLSSAKVRVIDAPNLGVLHMERIWTHGGYLDAILSNLSMLHSLTMCCLHGVSSLHIRSMRLERLFMYNFPLDSCTVDAPNLGLLWISGMNIPEKDIYKMLSNLPILHTLQIGHTLNFAQFILTSESLRNLLLYGWGDLEEISIVGVPCLENIEILDHEDVTEISIIDAPSLQTVFINAHILQHANVRTINVPEMLSVLKA